MIRIFASAILMGLVTLASANKITTEDYIDQYKSIAVTEMHRTGIPASITIAQGILESGSGNSRLATEANNHFGIKCHDWKGPAIYMDDDAKDECFRKYRHAEESYLDHSDFLTTRSRYGFLFDYDRTDYKAWAHGLKKAGYATNPQYGHLLIGLIERYNLQQYDHADQQQMMAQNDDKKPEIKEKKEKQISSKIFYSNRIKTVYLQPNQSLGDIAETYDVREKKLKKYNEIEGGQQLETGMKVYLQPKRRKAESKVHKVREGESLYDISQMYGIKMKFLYKRNLMDEGEEPATGERIFLRKKRDKTPKLRTTRLEKPAPKIMADKSVKEREEKKESPALTEIFKIEEQETKDDELIFIEDDGFSINNAKPDNNTGSSAKTTEKYTYHTVKTEDTLYSLSKKYNVTVQQLREWNGLQDNTIKIGQAIIVGVSK